jgi:heptosyltransferase-2
MGEMKVIVRAPNWVGDCVLAVPALRSLRRGFPQAGVWVAARAGTEELFAVSGLADGTIILPEDRGWRGLRLAAGKVREGSFDVGLLLTNSFGSALLFYFSGIPERWGYAADGRSLLLTKAVHRSQASAPRHHVHYYLDLVAGPVPETLAPELKIGLPETDREAARVRLERLGVALSRPIVTICPGASYGPAKRWPAERFAAASALIQERHGAEIVIVGSAAEAGIAEAVRKGMRRRPHILTGLTSLRELMGVIAWSTLLIANDTGPMHLANALGVPVVGIFGPTDPAVTGPFAPPARVVKKDVPCWPCYYRSCPLDHRCMMLIAPAEVAGAAESLWP